MLGGRRKIFWLTGSLLFDHRDFVARYMSGYQPIPAAQDRLSPRHL